MSSIPVLKYNDEAIVIPTGHEDKLDNVSVWYDSNGEKLLIGLVFNPKTQNIINTVIKSEHITNGTLFFKDFNFIYSGQDKMENSTFRILVQRFNLDKDTKRKTVKLPKVVGGRNNG